MTIVHKTKKTNKLYYTADNPFDRGAYLYFHKCGRLCNEEQLSNAERCSHNFKTNVIT